MARPWPRADLPVADEQRLLELELPPMVSRNTAKMNTPFTVSVDALEGTTTGISAQDRARTIRALIDPGTRRGPRPPGACLPLRAAPGGVLRRAGHTEASLDLAAWRGSIRPGALRGDGRGRLDARLPELARLSSDFGLTLISVADLIAFRRRHEVSCASWPPRPSRRTTGCSGSIPSRAWSTAPPPRARARQIFRGVPRARAVHSECLTGDASSAPGAIADSNCGARSRCWPPRGHPALHAPRGRGSDWPTR